MDKYNDIQQEAIDERIDSFIRGTMTEEEEAAFKQEIQAGPELRAQVLATISLIKGIRSQEAEKEKDIIDKNVKVLRKKASPDPYKKLDTDSKRPSSRTRSIMLWACSIAALFVIFFGVYKEKRYRDLSAIVSPYYSEYSMSESPRGDDVDSVTVAHLYTLFNNIKEQRDVSDIIKELEMIYASLDSDFTYSAYANDIAMNLALAYIKDDQIDKAIPILKKLEKDNPDTPIASKAKKLLEELRK
jgi:hypothetical protein